MNVLKRHLQGKLEEVLLSTRVVAMIEEAEGLEVTFELKDGSIRKQLFAKVLVAVGRLPNGAGLGLENTRIELDERGFVPVDPQRRTVEPSIFAIGNVAGEPMLAHKAHHEAHVAVAAIPRTLRPRRSRPWSSPTPRLPGVA